MFGGVVPRATTVVFLAIRVTVYGWAVSPRKNGPVFRLELEPVDDVRLHVAGGVDLRCIERSARTCTSSARRPDPRPGSRSPGR